MTESTPRPARRVCLLSNPKSGSNRRRPGAVKRVLQDYPETICREAHDPDEVRAALAEMAEIAPDVLVINGGDGTVQAVLTHLLGDQPLPWRPELALLRGGTTNMTAADLGLSGRADRAFRRLLEWARSGARMNRVERAVLAVQANPQTPRRCGMFFGAGAIIKGIEYFHRAVNRRGLGGELGPGVSMLRVLLAMVRKDARFVAPVSMRFDLEPVAKGEGPAEGDYLVVLASTLERLFLGLHPYWGEHEGAVHFTSLRAEPVRPWSTMPRLLFGRPGPGATPANGYFSGRVDSVSLEMDGEFTLDGEIYSAARSAGPVRICDAGSLSFIQV